jgi:MoaA/NifB/PqqE/SkfB family radical SAM enzyme
MAFSFLRNLAIIQIYKTFNIDLARPTRVIAQLNYDCNSRCSMCDVWRQGGEELPAPVWIETLKQLRSSIGYFTIGFAGGEILLKDDVFQIFEFCQNNKIPYTITTNGKLLTPENTKRLIELNPLNINISLDSLDSNTYQEIRGVPFLEYVKSNIDFLMTCIYENSSDTKVFLKTVVNNLNLSELPAIADYARKMHMAGITFDPIRRRRNIFIENKIEAFEKMASINYTALHDSVRRLIELKKNGTNILNTERRMKQWFNENHSAKKVFCNAPLRDIYINPEGYVRFCDYSDSHIGNIGTDNIFSLIKGDAAKSEKNRLTRCLNHCDYCIHRGILDYYKLFLSYIKN